MARPASVRDYMSRIVIRFTPHMDVLEALRMLMEKGVGGGPVVDKLGNLVGVLAEKDCVRAALTASYHEQWGGRVSEYLQSEVETVDADANIADVAKLFIEREYKQFPVMAEDRLVGQLSRTDVLKALAALRHERE